MAKIFIDASYAIALPATTDRYHKLAEMLAEKTEAEGAQLIRTIVISSGGANA